MSFNTTITSLTPTLFLPLTGETPLIPSPGPIIPDAINGPGFYLSDGPLCAGAGVGFMRFEKANQSHLAFWNRGLDPIVSAASACTAVLCTRIRSGNTTGNTAANNILWKTVSGTLNGLNLNLTDGERLRIGGRSRSADAFQSATSTNIMPLNQWVLVIAEWGFTTKTLRLWFDSTLEVNATSVAFGVNTYTQSSTTTYDSLCMSTETADNCANVDLGPVAFFNRALSDTERGDILTAWLNRPQVSGVVYDDAGAPCAREIFVYERASGQLVGKAASDAVTGAYTIPTRTMAEVIVVAKDDGPGTLYNDLIARVLP